MPVARLLPVVALVAVAAALTLTGCTPTPSPSSSASGTVAPVPTPNEPSTSAVPTPTASVIATPVRVACDKLISADTMYAFNPNFVSIGDWKPAASTAAGQAVAYKGVACRWQNETSNDVIDLSVASLDAATLESLKNQAVGVSTLVPTYEGADEGYFAASGGTGTAVVFVRSYWIVLTSQQFAEPGDPADLVASVMSALPS
jgi:hypothetical protein